MDVGMIKGALDVVKGLMDIKKGLAPPKDSKGVDDQLGKIYALLLEAQKEQLALLNAHAECEKELTRYKTFECEKDKYVLKELSPHSYAYAKQPVEGEVEAPHHLCASCFQDAKKSILQFSAREVHWDTLKCPKCGSQVRVPNDVKPTIMIAGTQRDWGPAGY